MKTRLIILITLLITLSSFAQQGINYKALIKDSDGDIIADQSITVQFTILQGSTNVYIETHTPTTDANGIIIINIGKGSVQSGDFTAINWASDDHFLNVQIDTSNGLVDMGITQFMAVPYALNAANVPTQIDDLDDGRYDGSSLFIGQEAGKNDNENTNENVGIGYQALFSNTSGHLNSAIGYQALYSNTIGVRNTANGDQTLFSNTTGGRNTANGYQALYANITGHNNTANGYQTLTANTSGTGNTANGHLALYSNTTGNENTATGDHALFKNSIGNNNVANGYFALYSNTTGRDNTANGYKALHSNTTGGNNTSNGFEALYSNTIGYRNTAGGYQALYSNIDGAFNNANGYRTLFSNTTGSRNTAIGYFTLNSNTIGNFNTAIGAESLLSNTTGYYNTAIGQSALNNVTTGNNNIGIGSHVQVPNAKGSYQVRIGNAQIIYAGIQVAWTITSDKRWKDNIRQLPYGLNMVTRLNPVDYIRKNNNANTREIGFIAQEVEKVLNELGYKNQGFLTKDDNGYLSLRYNDFIPILTKAIQEQQAIINNLQSKVNTKLVEIKQQNDKIKVVVANNELQHKTIQQLAQRIERLESSNQ